MSTAQGLTNQDIARVDCHQHFWQLSHGYYSWLTPELKHIYQDFLPQDLAPALKVQNVTQTVLVQAADTDKEIDFLLNIANNTEFVAGVVAWVDMEQPFVLNQLKSLLMNPYFKGIRPMLQDIDDENWILKDQFSLVFKFLAENQLTFDALITDIHLANIHILAQRYPTLSIVINHCAKPDLSKGPSSVWHRKMLDISTCENVYIKFSGLLTQAPQGPVTVETIQPYFDHIMAAFGPDRIMWGSDWPVMKLNGDYDTWISLTQSLLKNYSLKDKRKIWASNAQKFYKLPPYQVER